MRISFSFVHVLHGSEKYRTTKAAEAVASQV